MMPFAGINMATPIEMAGTSQIYLIPDAETTRDTARKDGEIKMLVIKFFELLICCIALLTFILSTAASVSATADMIISAILGFYSMYPLMVLLQSTRTDYNKLIFFNVFGALTLFTLGIYGASNWWDMEFDLEEESYDFEEDLFESIKHGADMKICSATFTILASVLYLIESIVMLLHIIGFKL